MASLQRSFEMAAFSVDDYPDTEYEAYIRERPNLFRSIHLSVITVNSSEREAEQIRTSVENGETTFEDAARSYSEDDYKDRGGDMGIKMIYELVFDIPGEADREKVIALARGEYSDVIKTNSGWSLFRIEDALHAADISDYAVMEKVRSYVNNYERGRMEDWAIEQANNFISQVNEFGFDDALSQLGKEKSNFGPVPLNYGNVNLFPGLSSGVVSASASNENFWKIAFSTPINSPSEPVVQGSNILVLFPTEETEADTEYIKSSYDYWLNDVSTQALSNHFMNSPKMEDRFSIMFQDMYSRYITE